MYCGKQQSSWHGTTVQVVQPKPLTLLDTSQNNTGTTRELIVPATHPEATTNLLVDSIMYNIFGSTDGDTDTDIIDVDTDTDINKLFFDLIRNIYTQMSYVKFRVSQKRHSTCRTTYNSLVKCT